VTADSNWRRFLCSAVLTAGGLLAAIYIFIVLMNPFGHLPLRPFGPHAIMDINQRFQYPAIARAGIYDSIVIGTSSARLLDPDRLDAVLGGRFANLAMNAALAWEQTQLAHLFLRHEPRPKTLLLALDQVWCAGDADIHRITDRGFPEWMYDEVPWNDWHPLLNWRTLEIAGRLLLHRLGLKPERMGRNGFEVFVPPETAYDAPKAAKKIWALRPHGVAPVTPSHVATEQETRSWRFPALVWLDGLLAAAPAGTRLILAFMPAHVAAQPLPGSAEAARDSVCKARVSEIAARYGAALIDFRIHSAITTVDANFWDPLHYRLPIADRIVDEIGRAIETRDHEAKGDWAQLR
jgi:hypothetical protein